MNNTTQFLDRLPLLFDKLPKKHYEFLFYKWGGVDGEWHSIKNAIKTTGIGLTYQEAETLEASTVKKIEDELVTLFTCPRCNKDIRKGGLRIATTGIQTANASLSESGEITRTNNANFSTHNFSTQEINIYICLSCDYVFEPKSPPIFFLQNGMRESTVKRYLKSFKKIDVGSIPKPVKGNNNAYHPTFVMPNIRW